MMKLQLQATNLVQSGPTPVTHVPSIQALVTSRESVFLMNNKSYTEAHSLLVFSQLTTNRINIGWQRIIKPNCCGSAIASDIATSRHCRNWLNVGKYLSLLPRSTQQGVLDAFWCTHPNSIANESITSPSRL